MSTPATPMRADIARQPEMLAGLVARARAFTDLGAALLRPGAGGRILTLGCGDGAFAGLAASAYATSLGLDWRATGALDLALGATHLTPADRVIAMSMSGNVDRTVEAAREVQAAGVPMLALVNGDGGKLGAIATRKISLEISDLAPFLCGTASYTATLAALMLLAAGAAGANPDFTGVGAAQAAAITASDAILAAATSSTPSGVRILSARAELGSAQYGAAKFVELTRLPVWSADLEEFAHSQYWSMPVDDLVVVIATDPALAARAQDSCSALSELGVRTLAIDTTASPVAAATHRVTLPTIDAALAPLVSAVPLQLLAYAFAKATGLDPNTRSHLKADAQRFKVSRLLTRRSLLGTGQ